MTTAARSVDLFTGGLPLLRLLQLASAALPIGAFAYSQGLEQAVAMGWVRDEASAKDWILGLLSHGVATLDLPVFLRLGTAFSDGNLSAVYDWNDFLFACRGGAELQAEERHLGASLAKVLRSTGVAPVAWEREPGPTYVAMFALAAGAWAIPPAAAAAGYAFAWTEAQVGAATRLCPLGQQAAQRILSAALPIIQYAVSSAPTIADDDLGTSAPAQAVASALHESLYSRLCRS